MKVQGNLVSVSKLAKPGLKAHDGEDHDKFVSAVTSSVAAHK
jgi:hypothetical protein